MPAWICVSISDRSPIDYLKPAAFVAASGPAAWLVHAALTDGLGAEPVEKIAHVSGISALVLLFLTLAVTPLRRATGWNQLIRMRRTLGLFAFFYVCVHASDYFVFDQSLSVPDIASDVAKHPWVLLGFSGFVLLVPLAVTSTKGWVRRLGGKRWQRLHRLVYAVAALGVAHYFLSVKRDVSQPLAFAGVLATIFAARIASARLARRRRDVRVARPVVLPPVGESG